MPLEGGDGRVPYVKRRSRGTTRTAGFKGICARPQVLATAILGVVLALSGCQASSPTQTNIPYQPADGIAVDLGDVQIRDLLVVANAKGEAGTLSGMVYNKSQEPVTVTFAAGPGAGGLASAFVPASGRTRLSGVEGTAPVTLRSVGAAPGDMLKVIISTPAAGSPQVSVPVLPPTGYYARLGAATTQPTDVPVQPAVAPVLPTPAPAQSSTP